MKTFIVSSITVSAYNLNILSSTRGAHNATVCESPSIPGIMNSMHRYCRSSPRCRLLIMAYMVNILRGTNGLFHLLWMLWEPSPYQRPHSTLDLLQLTPIACCLCAWGTQPESKPITLYSNCNPFVPARHAGSSSRQAGVRRGGTHCSVLCPWGWKWG